MSKTHRYFAFISYKREDEKWAIWLQHRLEHYKLPTSVRRGDSTLPERVRPVFKDTTDLSGGILGRSIEEALHTSKYLIVICSPHATQSPWICREVQTFIDAGREEYIIPFIIDGEPNSRDASRECFPENLRTLSGERELLGININEMGREAAAIKVVARMFSLHFDTLWQRWERERRRSRNRRLLVAAAVVVAALVVAVTFQQKNEELKAINWAMMENQARAVAHRAKLLINDGDAYLARRLLLEVLPDENNPDKYPYVPEVEEAFRAAMDSNSTVLHGHNNKVRYLNFSPDGQYVLSCSEDQTIKLWNIEGGVCIKTFEESTCVYYTAFSADGKYIVVPIHSDNPDKIQCHVLDIEQGVQVKSFDCSGERTRIRAISSDGRYIAIEQLDSSIIEIWDVEQERCIHQLKRMGLVERAIFSPNNKYLVLSRYCENTEVWSVENGTLVKTIKSSADRVTPGSFSSDGRYLALDAEWDGTIEVWDLYEDICVQIFEVPLHSHSIISPSGKYIVAVSDEDISVYDIKSGWLVNSCPAPAFQPYYITITPDGKYLVYGCENGDIVINADIPACWENNILGGCKDIAFGSDERYVFLARYPEYIHLSENPMDTKRVSAPSIEMLDIETRACVKTFKCHLDDPMILSIAISKNGKYILSYTQHPDAVNLWDTQSGTCIKALEFQDDRVVAMSFTAHSNNIICVTGNGDIHLWSIERNELSKTIHNDNLEYASAAISTDGRYVAISDYRVGKLYIMDIEQEKPILHLDCSKPMYFVQSFSPDGKYLSVVTAAGVDVFDIATGELVKIFDNSMSVVTEVEFSPDGKYVATRSHNRTVKLWDMEKRVCVYTYDEVNEDSLIFSLHFSPDSRFLLTRSSNKVMIWPITSLHELIEQAKEQFKDAPLTDEEREMYFLK